MENDSLFYAWFNSLNIVCPNKIDEVIALCAWFKVHKKMDAEIALVSTKTWKRLKLTINHLGEALLPPTRFNKLLIDNKPIRINGIRVYRSNMIIDIAVF